MPPNQRVWEFPASADVLTVAFLQKKAECGYNGYACSHPKSDESKHNFFPESRMSVQRFQRKSACVNELIFAEKSGVYRHRRCLLFPEKSKTYDLLFQESLAERTYHRRWYISAPLSNGSRIAEIAKQLFQKLSSRLSEKCTPCKPQGRFPKVTLMMYFICSLV